MWQPVNIELRNFVSHEKSKYTFQGGETVMIYGVNLDDGDSNGSGKSALVKAITFCLSDLPSKELTKEDYIRDGAGECMVEMYLENNVTKTTLGIRRRIFSNTKSAELEVYENGEHNTELTSVNEGNARILELLDISKEDLLNYFIINQENSHSFFRASDGDKKKIISRFTNSVLVDKVLEQVNEDYDYISVSMAEQNGELEQAERLLENHTEQIEHEEEGRKAETEKLYRHYTDELGELRVELKELRGESAAKKGELNQLKANLEKLGSSDTTVLDKNLRIRKGKLEAIEQTTKEAKRIKAELDTKIAGEIECPSCGHAWSTTALEDDLEELKELHQECSEALEACDEKVKEIGKLVEKARAGISKKKQVKDNIKRYKNQIEDAREDIGKYKTKLVNKEKAIEDLTKKSIDFLHFVKDTERIKELKKGAKQATETIDECAESIERSRIEQESVDFWRINFGMSGFKTFLVNKVLTSLEGYVNYHLKQFNTGMMVKINGFRVLKTGEVRETIEVLVTKDTRTWKKFQRFSGGQKERVNVCGILTIQKLINMTSKAGGLNLLVLDEFFEGLDAKGQSGVLNILSQTSVTNLVISHNNNDIGADNELWVRYEDGVSELVTKRKEILELKN